FFPQHDRSCETDDNHAQSLKWINIAKIEVSEQAECHEEVNGHGKNAAAEKGDDLGLAATFDARRFHGVIEKKLTRHDCNPCDWNKNKYWQDHNFYSKIDTDYAVRIRPMS